MSVNWHTTVNQLSSGNFNYCCNIFASGLYIQNTNLYMYFGIKLIKLPVKLSCTVAHVLVTY